MSSNFTYLKNPSPWRRLSLATWKAPNDPTVYGVMKIDATNLLSFLENLKIKNQKTPKITVTHVVAKAVALTLKNYPDINGIIRWGNIYLRKTVDIFLQVAVAEASADEKPDLSGAKVNRCDEKSLTQIAEDLAAQATKIRNRDDAQFKSSHQILKKVPSLILAWALRFMTFIVYNLGFSFPKLGLPEDPFGSAMVTSVGMLGVPPGFAPLVPISRVPLILCVGGIENKPWVTDKNGTPTVEVRPVLDIHFTFDHRFMDGLTGSRMYKYLKEILTNPTQHLGQ